MEQPVNHLDLQQKISLHSESVELEGLSKDNDKGISEDKDKGAPQDRDTETSEDKDKVTSEDKDKVTSEDKDKGVSEIQNDEKSQESPNLKKVSPIPKTQSLSPSPQTSANTEGKSKKIRQSQPTLPIPSDVENLTSGGSKLSAAKEGFKSDYNIEELRMRLKDRPCAALRMMQQSIYLEQVASVGPCVRTLNEGPSGIMIIVPKKCSRVDLDPDRVSESKINRIRSRLMTLKQSKILPRTASLYARISTIMRQYVNRIFVPNNTQDEENQQNEQISNRDISIRESVIEAEIKTN